MRRGPQEPDAPRLATTSDAYLEPRQLLAPFFNMSKVGFGICDNQLRYQAINGALAASNRLPAEAHLGNTVRGVMGEVAAQIESAFERVFGDSQACSEGDSRENSDEMIEIARLHHVEVTIVNYHRDLLEEYEWMAAVVYAPSDAPDMRAL